MNIDNLFFIKLFRFFVVLCCIPVGHLAYAQQGFDIKKKSGFNDKTLQAVVISGASHAVSQNKYGSSSRTLAANVASKKSFLPNGSIIDIEIHRKDDGTASFIAVNRSQNKSTARTGTIDVVSASAHFLDELKSYMGMSDDASFELTETNELRSLYRQHYKGIEVYGSEIAVHLDEYGEGKSISGQYNRCALDLNVTYAITEAEAMAIVTESAQKTYQFQDHGDHPWNFGHKATSVKKVIYLDETNQAFLAYEVEVMPHLLAPLKYFVDGKSGTIIKYFKTLCAMDGPTTAVADDLNGVSRRINTLFQSGTHLLADVTKPMFNNSTSEGAILTFDANNTQGDSAVLARAVDNTWSDPAAVSAHYNAGIAYDYFLDNHDWNSINGQRGNIISLVNVSDEFGGSLENAFWNGQAIFYGNGGDVFRPLAASLDVAGHEMTHGVIQNTANLEYQDESGAINESMADVFGFMMDQEDWQIGEDVVNPNIFRSGALRDLEDPNQGGTTIRDPGYQPAHVDDQFFGTEDNGGVHINSGIPNHAFFLLASEIGNQNAANIFFLALSKYLTRFSQFIDLRLACEQSAKDLFGEAAMEVTRTSEAFDGVGIVEGTPTEVVNSLPPAEGDEFLLSVDTDDFQNDKLFRSSANGTEFLAFTDREIINKPSITKDGKTVYFISDDNAIYQLDISNPSEPVERLINNQLEWANVSVSKNGDHLAAVTRSQDTSIYVLNFDRSLWGRFELYNPTFTNDVTSPGPVYADALEWDFTGEFLVYDAFNRLGDSIEYWDVNFLHAWDNEAEDFGDGTIEKMFASLPNNVSIGNPSFSKNSPFILAFDFIRGDDQYAIFAFDIENNFGNVLYENNTIGWPNFNNLDDRVAFTTETAGSFGRTTSIVAAIGVDSTKVKASTEAVGVINNAVWPIYYTVPLSEDPPVVLDVEPQSIDAIGVFPNPTTGEIFFKSPLRVKQGAIFTMDGLLLQDFDIALTKIDMSEYDPGIYILSLTLENEDTILTKIVKR